jgi:hypothetical protein
VVELVSVVEFVSVIKSPNRHLPRPAQDHASSYSFEILFVLLPYLSIPICIKLISRV